MSSNSYREMGCEIVNHTKLKIEIIYGGEYYVHYWYILFNFISLGRKSFYGTKFGIFKKVEIKNYKDDYIMITTGHNGVLNYYYIYGHIKVDKMGLEYYKICDIYEPINDEIRFVPFC